MVDLSVLVLTVPNRIRTFFPHILEELNRQSSALNEQIEIIGLYDNKKRTVGEKRNSAISIANGRYLSFVDDDDNIAPDYLFSIMKAIHTNNGVDCIVFDCITTINGNKDNQTYSKYSKNYSYTQGSQKENGYIQWRGKVSHTMVWKSEIVKKHIYKSVNYGEDIDWCVRANKDIKTEHRIDKVLYYYNFDSGVTETR